MSIEFDGIDAEKLGEDGAAALALLKTNDAFKGYISETLTKREDAIRQSVSSEYEPWKKKAEEASGKVNEFRENNLELVKKLDSFKDFDADEYRRLKSLGSDAKKASERLSVMEAEYQAQLKKSNEELQARESSIGELTGKLTEMQQRAEDDAFKFSAQEAIAKHNADKESVAVKPRAAAKLIEEMAKAKKIVDGRLVMMNNGREFTTDSGIGSLYDWIDKVGRVEFDYMFEMPSGGGALGNNGANNGSGQKMMTRNQFEAITDSAKRAEVGRTHTIID